MKLLSLCVCLVVVCLMACSRKGLPQAGTTSRADSSHVKKDSTWSVKEIVYDTIFLPGDSVEVQVLIECDKATNKPKDITIGANGNNSKMVMTLRNGILNVKSKYDSAMKIVAHQKETIHHLQQELTRVNNEKSETIIKEVYLTHWYDIAARWISLIVIIIIILLNLKPKLL